MQIFGSRVRTTDFAQLLCNDITMANVRQKFQLTLSSDYFLFGVFLSPGRCNSLVSRTRTSFITINSDRIDFEWEKWNLQAITISQRSNRVLAWWLSRSQCGQPDDSTTFYVTPTPGVRLPARLESAGRAVARFCADHEFRAIVIRHSLSPHVWHVILSYMWKQQVHWNQNIEYSKEWNLFVVFLW